MINTAFSVTILPTIFGYSPLGDMYPGTFPVPDGEGGVVQVQMNLIDVQYQIVAEKYEKEVTVTDELGVETTEKIWVDFTNPVVFDTGKESIPFALHLAIESYRNEPNEGLLAAINQQLQAFPFKNSMQGFVLQVSDIK